MNITGIRVIKPGVAAIGVVAGEKIELTYGDTLKVNVSFEYRGLARETILEGAIGKLHAFPTEWLEVLLKSGTTIDIPESFEFTTYERSVEIPITADIDPGTDYDLSVSLRDYREAGHPTEVDVIDIVGIPPTFDLIEETIYPYAYVYDGPCDIVTFTFTTIPFTPADWVAGKLAAHCEDEVKKAGGRVMEMRVYVDESQWRPWTNWRIEIIGTPPGEAMAAAPGIAVGVPVWVAIILVILAIIALIIVTYHFIIKPLTYKPKGLTEELKEPMSRETLIGLVNDFEVKLIKEGKIPGPPTPPEELEGMSGQELRDYADMLAEKVVPPEPEFPWPLAILGGVVIVGGGVAALALAARRKK